MTGFVKGLQVLRASFSPSLSCSSSVVYIWSGHIIYVKCCIIYAKYFPDTVFNTFDRYFVKITYSSNTVTKELFKFLKCC